VPFKSLIPLDEIIADVFGMGQKSKKVTEEYLKMTDACSEFDILIELNEEELNQITEPEIAKGILNARAGDVFKTPGYDGVFGTISVTGKKVPKKKKIQEKQQMGLF
jgi:PHP family Zn ribbon phosphoesterase